MRLTSFAIALACLAPLHALASAPLSQPASERTTQKSLPQSKAPLWAVLRRTRIGEDDRRGVFTAAFPPEVKALDGKVVTLSGFMLPMDASAASTHFLLSKYTPVCFFCPPGQPNEVVEVTTTRGVPITDRMLSVTGRIGLENRADKGLFFRMQQASAK